MVLQVPQDGENFSGHMFIGLIVELNDDTKEPDHQPVMGLLCCVLWRLWSEDGARASVADKVQPFALAVASAYFWVLVGPPDFPKTLKGNSNKTFFYTVACSTTVLLLY